MEKLSYDALVELITAEVLKVIAQNNIISVDGNGKIDKRPIALVIGNGDKLPESIGEKYRLAPLEEYEGDISRYDAVYIARLTLSELADCALCRDSTKASCAVSHAFLSGKKVYLAEDALPHRKYADTASRVFFKTAEGYVNTLRSFGAEFLPKQWQGKNNFDNAVADNTADRVVTESTAISLCEKNEDGVIKLRCGTVITPSAKDIFLHSGKTVEFV